MLHRLPFHAMGCEMLAILENDSDNAPDMLACVPEWFEGWEQTLSRFRYDSELSHLNRSPDQLVPVSQTLWDVFQASLGAERITAGLVTPTILEAVESAGYSHSFDELFASQVYVGMQGKIKALSTVVVDETTFSICLPPGLRLDFGGIAKGWAAHQAAEILKSWGPVVMNAGGDIAISGSHADGNPWLIGVSNPFEPGQDYATLHLHGGGVATSGKDRRRWMLGDTLKHHIIDPRTGNPAVTDILTATVVAPSVMEAEAAAKAVFLLGSEAGLNWLEADSGLAGLLVLDNGQVITSHRVEKYL